VRVESIFWVEILGRPVQRRGVHVNVPEIGSRDGGLSFGGILDIYAELRRDFNWRNLKVGFFGFWWGFHVEGLRRGDQQCALWGIWGN
jgi:hypothetical protein